MTLPALTTPAPHSDLRAEFWASRTRNREAEARLLWAAFLRWQLEPGNRDAPPWAFLVWLCEGQDASPGSLYNTFDRSRALASGYSGSLTRLAQIGRALRSGLTRAEIDALTPDELAERLRRHALTAAQDAAAALAPVQERTRALLRDADPTAPTAPPEADALNLSVLEVLPAPLYRAAVQAVQTGDVTALSDLNEATKPPTFGDFLKQRGTCYVCGQPATGGTVLDLHHTRVGEHEARRNDGGPETLVGVHRACHVPVPFSDRVTAHSRAFAVGRDADALARLVEYLTTEHARYGRFIRGET